MNRRDFLLRTGASALTLGLARLPVAWAAPGKAKPRVLMFTKSGTFEHSVVKRKGTQLSLAERIVTDLGAKHNFDVTCTKDGRAFVNEDLSKVDVFLFETQGDLTKEGVDHQPAMPPEGKKAFLKAIAEGKGFVGCHCASDTCHSPGDAFQTQEPDRRDPYIAMLGGEFIKHGPQQKAWMRVTDPAFPGAKGLKDFELNEEWYSLKNFAPDIHVILVQDTQGMKGSEYQRANYPATWARKHHNGRVFYTSLGHREDVWENPLFQGLLVGAVAWAAGNVSADLKPNLDQAAPKAGELPPKKPAVKK